MNVYGSGGFYIFHKDAFAVYDHLVSLCQKSKEIGVILSNRRQNQLQQLRYHIQKLKCKDFLFISWLMIMNCYFTLNQILERVVNYLLILVQPKLQGLLVLLVYR